MNSTHSLTPQPTSRCARYQPLLALLRTDALSPQDAARLTEHVAGCRWCQRELAAYGALDAAARHLVSDRTFTPLTLAEIAHASDAPAATFSVAGRGPLAARRSGALAAGPPQRLPSPAAAFGAVAAVLLIGVVVAGFAALLVQRQPGPGATTGFNGDYGPTVLPSGPQPQVGHWRTLALPSGISDQLALLFSVTPQTSVPDLLYGCFQQRDDAQAPGPLRLWRSEDEGRTWKGLSTPAGLQNGCYLDVFPGAPDTVFVTGSTVSKGDTTYYSLDRGEHWQTLQRPTGSASWQITAPTAEGDVWYYIRTEDVPQPEIWVSRDHGSHWTSHTYPVRFPPAWVSQWSSSAFGSNLWLRYEKGGLLFLFERTLWWSPDYGATWQKVDTWSEPPCSGAIFGTPDLSVLYCIEWSGDEDPNPYWRSLDYGQTWKAVPRRPMAPVGASREGGITRISDPIVLRDGSLLKIAAIPGATNDSDFYSLAPNANVWIQASTPLNDSLGPCPQPTPGVKLPAVCSAGSLRLANGPPGVQYVYQERATDGKTMIGEITW
jgi:hypothetical protein